MKENKGTLQRSIAFAVLTVLSFVLPYINAIIKTYIPFGIGLCCVAVLLLVAEGLEIKIPKRKGLSLGWVMLLILVAVQRLRLGLNLSAIMEIITFGTCMLGVFWSGKEILSFEKMMQIVTGFAVYYAVTVWIQVLLPGVHQLFLALLPKESARNVLELQVEQGAYAGFATNTGFTAGFICAGIVAVSARILSEEKKCWTSRIVMLVFLVVTLLLTGKRGPLLAVMVVLCMLYVVSGKGSQYRKRFAHVGLAVVGGILLLVFCGIFLRFIPVVSRLVNTLQGLVNGEDITTGRGEMYAFAIELFKQKPLFGHGWGAYRQLMVGNVTLITEMDCHNIYLQLLAETGMVGTLLTVSMMIMYLIAALRGVRYALNNGNVLARYILMFSLGYQIYFAIYGITGNPLYDYSFLIMYALSCAACTAYARSEKADAYQRMEGKKRVGLITFHFVHNQGGVLQSYATQTFLKKHGHDARIIDYKPAYHTVKYASVKNPFRLAVHHFKMRRGKSLKVRLFTAARGFVRAVVDSLKRRGRGMERKFTQFINKNLCLTRTYKTLKQLQMDPPDADVYISGSDQLWNPDLLDFAFDPAYFLDFGRDEIKRMTYAVSLKEQYSEKEQKQLRKLLQRVDCLSSREESEVLTEVTDKENHVCIDPTLLLSQEDYAGVECPRLLEEPYIFVYGFETNERIMGAVQAVAEKLGIKVVNGSPHRIRLHLSCEKVHDLSPDAFLSYVHHADYVVTNSFHGTAFSLIYKKQFVVVAHTTRGRRMKELLNKLGLSGRLWEDATCRWQDIIPYEKVDEKLQVLRDESGRYLLDGVEHA